MAVMQRLLNVPAICTVAVRGLRDISHVPRPSFDRSQRVFKEWEYGYYWNYYEETQRLPRIKDCMEKIRGMPEFEVNDPWTKEEALFGQNDYIDLLGDGSQHPAQLMLGHVPKWLRGFPGQHRANELVRLIQYRNQYEEVVKRNMPKRWHELCKRLEYLMKYHNYRKSDEIRLERDLGLWQEEPDWFYKEKRARRWWKDFKDAYR